MLTILHTLRTVLSFVTVLGVLVFVHEMGHYLAARWRGVYVEKFCIGFGRALVTWKDSRNTEWSIGWIPLGGYVRMHGHEVLPGRVHADIRAGWMPGRTFHEKGVLDRIIIIAAGPLFNVGLAILLMTIVFASVGRPYADPTILRVVEGSRAASGGLLPGDRVLTADGMEVTKFTQLQDFILSYPGKPIKLRLAREGVAAPVELEVTPELRERNGVTKAYLGVGGGHISYEPVSGIDAVSEGVSATFTSASDVVHALSDLVTGHGKPSDLGGPLAIARMSGEVSSEGITSVLAFMAMLSVNLAVFNLLPVPILDGGYLVFYLYEAVARRPLPTRVMELGLKGGALMLMGFVLFATFNDLSGMGLFKWVASLVT